MVGLQDHLLCTCSHPAVVICAWPYTLPDGLRPSVWGFFSRPVAAGAFTGGPHSGRESLRVLGSLSSVLPLPGFRHLSRVCSSVWGPVGVARPFHPSLLLGGVLVHFGGGPCWRSLAMSWVWPPPFSLCRSRLSLPFVLSPLSHRVLVDVIRPLCVVALAAGASPHALGSVGAHEVRDGSTYIALRRPWSVSTVLRYTSWGSGRCLMLLPARLSASIHGDCLVSLPDLYLSQLKKSRGVVLLGHMAWRVTGLT